MYTCVHVCVYAHTEIEVCVLLHNGWIIMEEYESFTKNGLSTLKCNEIFYFYVLWGYFAI